MARNLNLFFDSNGAPRARGPSSEKLLMAFLEQDVQGSDHICHDLMDDITAIEDETTDSREFVGNAHSVVMTADGVIIECLFDEGTANPENEPATKPAAPDEASPNSTATANKSSPTLKSIPDEKKYQTGLKHFREVLEDWEAFILDDHTPA